MMIIEVVEASKDNEWWGVAAMRENLNLLSPEAREAMLRLQVEDHVNIDDEPGIEIAGWCIAIDEDAWFDDSYEEPPLHFIMDGE